MWNFTILHEWGHSSSTVHNISTFSFSFYQMKSHSQAGDGMDTTRVHLT